VGTHVQGACTTETPSVVASEVMTRCVWGVWQCQWVTECVLVVETLTGNRQMQGERERWESWNRSRD
jgi:hypothetical protein